MGSVMTRDIWSCEKYSACIRWDERAAGWHKSGEDARARSQGQRQPRRSNFGQRLHERGSFHVLVGLQESHRKGIIGSLHWLRGTN